MAAGDEVVLAEDVYYMGNHLTGPDYILAVGDGTPVIDCSPGVMPPTPESLIGEYCIFRDEGTEGYRIVDVDDVNETITVERNFPATLTEQMYIADLMNPSHATPFTWDVAGVATTNIFCKIRGESATQRPTIKRDPGAAVNSIMLTSGDAANQKFQDIIFDGNNTYGTLLYAGTAAAARMIVLSRCKFQNGGGNSVTNGHMVHINNANLLALALNCEFTNWLNPGTYQTNAMTFVYGNGCINSCYFHGAAVTGGIIQGLGIATTFETILVDNCIFYDIANSGGDAFAVGCNAIKGLVFKNNTIVNMSASGVSAGISTYTASGATLLWSISNNLITNDVAINFGLRETTNNSLSIAECDFNWFYNCTTTHDPANAAGAHDVTGIDPRLRDPAGGDFTPLNMQCYRAGKPDANGTPTAVGAIVMPPQGRRISNFNSNISGVF
jgi:hypothetical protein